MKLFYSIICCLLLWGFCGNCFGQNSCPDMPSNITVSNEMVDIYCPNSVFIPNVFSPNSDGKNDYFLAIGSAVFAEYEMKIFNRWGEMLFRSQHQQQGWDGYIHDNKAAEGVYFYIISFTKTDGRREQFSGSITLRW